MAAQAAGDTATPYVAIQYRSNIDHFRVVPVGGQSRRFGALCGTRDAYSANRTGPCPPSAFFSHDEKEREREKPTKGRVIGGLDGLFVRGTLIATLWKASDLALYDYIDLIFTTRKVPRRVWNPNRSTACSRPYIYARSHTHVWFMRLPLEFIDSR